MKVELQKNNAQQPPAPKYPNLFESIKDVKGIVVLATSEETGTVLYPAKSTWMLGDTCERWKPFSDRNTWKPYIGNIILTGE